MAPRAASATEDEVISAVFTLAMRGGNMDVVKDVLQRMLLECAAEGRPS